MKAVLLGGFILLTLQLQAQDGTIKDLKKDATRAITRDEKDTTNLVWKKGGLFNVNVNQGSLSNWSAGGDKFSFSLNSFLYVFAHYKKNKQSWDNSLDLAYGIVKTTSLGNRKSSDRIDILSKYGYALSKHFNAAVLGNFRSQFARGFAYSKTDSGLDSASLTSKTLTPAYILLSPGLDFKPSESFSLFVSPATARWVIVGDDLLAPLYGVPANKNSRQEFGAFASANYLQKIGANMTFKSKLDLFSNYKNNPKNIDIFWSNVLAAKITRYINVTFNIDMIYDDDTRNVELGKGPAPQVLQLMGIGFAYNFNEKKP